MSPDFNEVKRFSWFCPSDNSIFCRDWYVFYVSSDPFDLHGLSVILTWISIYTNQNVWDEIIYLSPNFNAPVEVWEWIDNFTPYLLDKWLLSNAGIQWSSWTRPKQDKQGRRYLGPLLLTWISNYIHYNVWDEITYTFLSLGSLGMDK